MAEKVRDKIERLSRDLAESVRWEVELTAHVRDLDKKLSFFKKTFTSYAVDNGLAHNEETSIAFLEEYNDRKNMTNEKQLSFDFVKPQGER